jgi:hypothetical protein
MPQTIDDLFGSLATKPLEVQPPGAAKSVLFRSPTFSEWYELTVEHRRLEGKEPPVELITKTVAVVLANPDGSRRLSPQEASVLLKADSQLVMWLYVHAWETVLRSDEKTARDYEKN